MQKTSIYLEKKQAVRATKLAKVKGFKLALLIRLALKKYLDEEEARETV